MTSSRLSVSDQIKTMLQNGIDAPTAQAILRLSAKRLEGVEDYSETTIEEALRGVVRELGVKAGPAFMVLRIAVCFRPISPPLFASFKVLGRERTVSRMREMAEVLEPGPLAA